MLYARRFHMHLNAIIPATEKRQTPSMPFLHLCQATLVTLASTLITADFLVLLLLLVHERLEFRVVVLGDSLGCHLDGECAVLGTNRRLNLLDSLLKNLDTVALVDRCACEDVEWWRDETDLDLGVLGALGLSHA